MFGLVFVPLVSDVGMKLRCGLWCGKRSVIFEARLGVQSYPYLQLTVTDLLQGGALKMEHTCFT